MIYHLGCQSNCGIKPNGNWPKQGQKLPVSPDMHPSAKANALKCQQKQTSTVWLRPIARSDLLQCSRGFASGLNRGMWGERIANMGYLHPSCTRIHSGENGGVLHPNPKTSFWFCAQPKAYASASTA